MKLLIVGIDGMSYNFLMQHINRFDYFADLMCKGKSTRMMPPLKSDGESMYTSMDIWTSLYCGMHPSNHKLEGAFMREEITGKSCVRTLMDLESHVQERYFWNVLNARGYRVGLFNGMCFNPAFDIEGFVYGTYPNANGAKYYPANIEKHFKPVHGTSVSPQPLSEIGYDEINEDNKDLIYMDIGQDYFYGGILRMFSETFAHYNTLADIIHYNPVDVLFYYAANLDIIQHFQFHEDSNQSIIESYQMFELLVQRLMHKYQPENLIIVSDHGFQMAVNGIKPRGCKAHLSVGCNGGVVSGEHAYDATLIIHGNDLNNKNISNVDITTVYKIILEVCQ